MQSNSPESFYSKYAEDPSKENLSNVVTSLQPVYTQALRSHGSLQNKILKTKARNITAKAIASYDPNSGSSLKTWTSRQLQGLSRVRRETNSVTHIPEKTHIQGYEIHKGTLELEDKLGREPDDGELSEHLKIPIRSIENIRKTLRKTPSEEALGDLTAQERPQYQDEAIDYIYADADHVDRKILEWKTGYGGKSLLSPMEIAARLKLTPSQLSRRSTSLSFRIQEIEDNLNKIQ